jgi:hypothetical protein
VRARCACLVLGAAAMINSAAVPALDFTLGVGPADNCPGRGVGVRAVALAYLEPAPVLLADEYGGRHFDPDDGNNIGVANGYADVTAPLGKVCLGIFYRTDYRGEASNDALDALEANHAKRPFDVGRNYALAVDSIYQEAAGIKLSRVFDFEPSAGWSTRLGITASLMKAITHREERLRGSATATSGSYALGTATLVRTLSDYRLKRFNPFVEKKDPEGYGWSTDLSLRVRSPAGHVLELTAMDAFSRIDWGDVPQSLETIDNQTIRYDANFNREAFVSGLDRRVSVEQIIEPRYRVAFSAPIKGDVMIVVSDDLVHQTHFPALGVSYRRIDRHAEVSLDAQTGALSLVGGRGAFRASITTNDLDLQEASVLGVELSFFKRW